MLRAIKHGQAWDRYHRFLDGGADPYATIQAAKDDHAGLLALRQELPAYVKATDPDAGGDYVSALMEAIDEAETPHLTET